MVDVLPLRWTPVTLLCSAGGLFQRVLRESVSVWCVCTDSNLLFHRLGQNRACQLASPRQLSGGCYSLCKFALTYQTLPRNLPRSFRSVKGTFCEHVSI